MLRLAIAIALGLATPGAALAAASEPPILVRNVRIFDGVHAEVVAGQVLVSDGFIQRVSSGPIVPPEGAVVLDGGDGVLCPGFIDLHAHLVENGVRSIEHGLLIDEETAKLVAERDVVISTQLYIFRPAQDDSPMLTERRRAKMQRVIEGRENLIRLIKKYDITTGFGTDVVFGQYPLVGREFTERAKYWTPAEVLRQATSESADVIRMAGTLDPYGRFGEIREGWIADLLVVAGNPLEDISLLEHPQTSLALIMKAGRIHRNRLRVE